MTGPPSHESAQDLGDALFRGLVEASPTGMVLVDAAGKIVMANARLASMFGYAKEELHGNAIESLVPARVQRVHEADRSAFVDHPTARPMGAGRDLYGVRRSGEEFPVEIGLNPIQLHGRSYVIASVIDITLRKRSERELERRERRMRALMDFANDAISVLSPEGVILEANPRLAELLGIEQQDLIGRRLEDFAAPGTPVQHRAEFEDLRRTGGGRATRVPLRRSDGAIILVDFSLGLMHVGDEDLLLSIGRDVTQEVHLQRQLRQSQKMEAVGRLAGGIAHDFNNLLTVIIGNAESLRDQMDSNDPRREDSVEIISAGERAAGLTRQLLAFSRQQVLAPRVVDLVEVVRGTEKMLVRVIGEDVELETRLDPNTGHVFADPSQIEQVILNLAVNSRDAMPEGGTLTIETMSMELDEQYAITHPPANPGAYVMLGITDSGVGMTREVQARIFEPFFTTKEAGKGTGLGLATVYGIVKQSGGYIWLYSEPGNGATFKVYLPRVSADAQPLPVPAPAMATGGAETLLLAEDDPMVRRLARRSLEKMGYRVLSAEDAIQALELAESHSGQIDLLVTDVIMPGMSGAQLAKRLLAQRPMLKVLYTSGYAGDAIVRHGIPESSAEFLQKPYTPMTLASRVRQVLEGRRPADPASP